MAVIKCKMCGGDMEISPDKTFGTCEYCGSTMTLPKIDDEQRAAAFNRGNHFRRIGEFDKALGVYERIVAEDDTDAEAHWCCALCRFGIEYVEDPATYEWLPTCHRLSFDSFLEDVDYLAAVEHSDGITRRQYQKDAAKIAEVQRGILATSQSAEPFDVFICYKESDENGERTRDSLLAQDIYYQLTEQGRHVFFARITLEDVAGTEYEPYIFAALNSARVMIVVGTKAEYLNAVWVKNEWSRFLSLMKKDRTKLLLPCYRDMDPYDMPEQLSILQSYDMSKIGFIQDLIRGVNKVLDGTKKPEQVKETVVVQQGGGGNLSALLKRGNMALEDGEWDKADGFFDEALNQDAENIEANLGKLLAAQRAHTKEGLVDCVQPFDGAPDYKRVLRFADEKLKAELEGYNAAIRERNELARKDALYESAVSFVATANGEAEFKAAAEKFRAISGYKDAAAMADQCLEKAENARKDLVYGNAARKLREAKTERVCAEAMREFESIPGWRDAEAQVEACRKKIEDITAQAEREKQANLDRARMAEAARKKKKRIGLIVAVVAVLAIAASVVVTKVVIPEQKYNEAAALLAAGDRLGAAKAFEAINGYSDAGERRLALWGEIAGRETVSVGNNHTVGLRSDGTVVAVGDNYNQYGQCNVSGWTDVVAVSAGYYHTVGLRSDGTAVAVGDNAVGQCNVSGWTDIVAVSARRNCTVGLRLDGTVVAVGNNEDGQCNVSGWTDVVAVSAGNYHTVGLRSDGTVVACGNDTDGRCDVAGWTDIMAVSAGASYTIGLKSDGTVVAAGWDGFGQCDVSDWTDVVAVSAGNFHTVGLRSDGTVVAVGDNREGQCDVSDWADIVAVCAGGNHTVGLRSDGTVVITGDKDGKCDVSGWTDIKLPGA